MILISSVPMYVPSELSILQPLPYVGILSECWFEQNKRTPWPEPASELYQTSDCHLSVKLVPGFYG
jgi:hypothetical protein